jgi:hypothetical protein
MSSNPAPGGPRTTTIWQALLHGRTLFTLLMFTIFAVMVYVAVGYSWPANFLPFIIGIPGMFLTALQVVLDIRDFHKAEGKIDPRTDFEKYMADILKHTGGKVQMELKEGTTGFQTLVEDHSVMVQDRQRREIILFAYFFGLLAVVLLFGFWIGYPIFMAAFLRFYSRETWKLTAYLTIGSWVVMYGILVTLLEQILFEGFVTEYVLNNWFPE